MLYTREATCFLELVVKYILCVMQKHAVFQQGSLTRDAYAPNYMSPIKHMWPGGFVLCADSGPAIWVRQNNVPVVTDVSVRGGAVD